MKQIKTFFTKGCIDSEVNKWIEKNTDKKILDIQYSCCADSGNDHEIGSWLQGVMITYEEKNKDKS